MLLGSGSHERFQVAPIVLWFLPCLFLAQLIVYGVCQIPKLANWQMLTTSIAIAVVGFALPIGLALPLELEEALVAQLFVFCGISIRRVNLVDSIQRPGAAGVLLLFLGSIFVFINDKVDMRISDYGSNSVLFVLNALSISLGIILISSKLVVNRVSQHLSCHTITIFPMHEMVFSIFSAVYVFVLGLDLSIRIHPLVGLAASLLNLVILALVAPLVRQVLPWIYGQKPSKKVAHASAPVTSPPVSVSVQEPSSAESQPNSKSTIY